MRQMAQNGARVVVFQREPARPPAGIPAPPEHPTWLRRGRFRVLLRATLLPDGCPVGVRRQVWTAQGGLKPPCIVTLL